MRIVQEQLKFPWLGIRPDIVLHPGPPEPDGTRTYVLTDPVRGTNFRLGAVEAELFYRLATDPDPDTALIRLYETTPHRPTVEEVAAFIHMLQRERLAAVPPEAAIHEDAARGKRSAAGPLTRLFAGAIFFRLPLLRPDRFLTRTLPYVEWLGSAPMRRFYLFCGLLGLFFAIERIEHYIRTVDYLFTPQGILAFVLTLSLLKTGHEFAHAYTAKSYGIHVRSMGIFFIVFWPLLYTDTTDAWRLAGRKQRLWISGAGVAFELAVGGMALLAWALMPDGVGRSLAFFLSGASLVSSIFINLNPFMRYDGYYVLMDLWGIDNLRPRAFALFRHAVRKKLFAWTAPPPEFHPQRRRLVVYGFFAALYRLLIGASIGLGVFYLFPPSIGLAGLALVLWLFVVIPLKTEISALIRQRNQIGSRLRAGLSVIVVCVLIALLFIPWPRIERLPALLMWRGAHPVTAPSAGRLQEPLPEVGRSVREGELLTRIESDDLAFEAQKIHYDLAVVKAKIQGLTGGGEQGAYRKWLSAEAGRLRAAYEKVTESIALLEIRAPADGRVVEVDTDLYPGAFVGEGTFLFTIVDPKGREVRAFVHERIRARMKTIADLTATVRFPGFGIPSHRAELTERGVFPVSRLPVESLYDIAGGPILTTPGKEGVRPRDAYFAFVFDVPNISFNIPHGTPTWLWLTIERRSVMGRLFDIMIRILTKRGLI